MKTDFDDIPGILEHRTSADRPVQPVLPKLLLYAFKGILCELNDI